MRIDYSDFEQIYKNKSPFPDIPDISEFNPIPNNFDIPAMALPTDALTGNIDSLMGELTSVKSNIESAVSSTVSELSGMVEVPSLDGALDTISNYGNEIQSKIKENFSFGINDIVNVNNPLENLDQKFNDLKGMGSNIINNNITGLIDDKLGMVNDLVSQIPDIPSAVTNSFDQIKSLTNTVQDLNVSNLIDNVKNSISALDISGAGVINKIQEATAALESFTSDLGLDSMGNLSLDSLMDKAGLPSDIKENFSNLSNAASEVAEAAASTISGNIAKNAEKYYNCLKW